MGIVGVQCPHLPVSPEVPPPLALHSPPPRSQLFPLCSRPALQLLLSFHNATFATALTPASPPDDLSRARATAAGLLSKKLIVRGALQLTRATS